MKTAIGVLTALILLAILNVVTGLVLTFKASVILGVVGLFMSPAFAIEGAVWWLSGYDIAANIVRALGIPA